MSEGRALAFRGCWYSSTPFQDVDESVEDVGQLCNGFATPSTKRLSLCMTVCTRNGCSWTLMDKMENPKWLDMSGSTIVHRTCFCFHRVASSHLQSTVLYGDCCCTQLQLTPRIHVARRVQRILSIVKLHCGSPSRWRCQSQTFDHAQRTGSDVSFESAARVNRYQTGSVLFTAFHDRVARGNVRKKMGRCIFPVA